MDLISWAIAAALLTSPAEPKTNGQDVYISEVYLQFAAIGLEVMDVRETEHIFRRGYFTVCDLRVMRDRYERLADAPRSHDSNMFLNAALLNELLASNRTYYQQQEAQLQVEVLHKASFVASMEEADELYRILFYAKSACDRDYNISTRRQALKDLREKIGYRDFYAGVLPPHLPIWRFQSID